MDEITETLFEFPCDFPLKIMGKSEAGFAQAVQEIVKRHAPDYTGHDMEMRSSKQGKYLSITCTIRAQSRQQLDALYQELCDHPMVVMAL